MGVDINHNYNAGWRVVKTMPGPTKYAGPYSESEPETKAIVEFVRKNDFDMLIAFHSQGREIYYDFDGITAEKSKALAERMAQVSGYAPCVPEGSASFGGCKDWFIKEFGKAGFTIEIGSGQNPLPMEKLNEIYDENAMIILKAMEELYEKVH
jgi:g-D-glutamyl-meso-diaminopimelate peptidase